MTMKIAFNFLLLVLIHRASTLPAGGHYHGADSHLQHEDKHTHESPKTTHDHASATVNTAIESEHQEAGSNEDMCAKEKLPYNACVFHKYTYKIGENVLCHWTQGPIHYDIHVDCHEGNEWHIYSVLRTPTGCRMPFMLNPGIKIIDYKQMWSFGETLNVRCKRGILKRPSAYVCGNNGLWAGKQPSCDFIANKQYDVADPVKNTDISNIENNGPFIIIE